MFTFLELVHGYFYKNRTNSEFALCQTAILFKSNVSTLMPYAPK
jgi:hypothetical protein